MDDLNRDLSRLGLIHQMPVGLESFSSSVYFKDFVHYYFTRFVMNLTHAFKDFTMSEIVDFNHRHRDKLELLFKYPTLSLNGIIVPIPKGMVKPYDQTLNVLMQCFAQCHPETIVADMQALVGALERNSVKGLQLSKYSKEDFDSAKVMIGKLFGKTGLTHATADHVLLSKNSIKRVNDELVSVTKTHYSTLINLNNIVKTLESKHSKSQLSKNDRDSTAQYLMTLAYRLSIIATVMNHVQAMEHSFVESLDILLKKIA
jgi:hypothetical protein